MRVLVVSWLSALSAATAASSSTTTNDVVHSNDDNCVLNADGVCENQGNTTPDDGNNSTENSAADADADNANDDHQIPFVWSNETSILDVLNPDVLNDRDIMDEIARRLRNHELVVIRDAFVPDFADFVWQDLNRDDLEWPAWEEIAQDGFSLSHSNFYWNDTFTTRMNETHSVFNHADSVEWIAKLSGRTITPGQDHYGCPSRFFPGDYTMPHSDYADERAVAYVWHLTWDWHPSWGGAFYWPFEVDGHHGYHHPSYNTLMLFSVTRQSQHLVTLVTDRAQDPEYKRLAWNGWYLDLDHYDYTDPVEELFDTYEKRLHMTAKQVEALIGEYEIEEQVVDDPKRVQVLNEWKDNFQKEHYGGRVKSFLVDVHESAEKEKARWQEEWDEYDYGMEEAYWEDEEYEEGDTTEYYRRFMREEEDAVAEEA